MALRWTLVSRQPDVESLLSREAGVSPLLAHLLAVRGVITPAAAQAFLHARLSEHLRSPMLFKDMPLATNRILSALRETQRALKGDRD